MFNVLRARGCVFALKKWNRSLISYTLQCVCSGHPRPVCGTVHPNGPGEQKKDQTHRQRHQPQMERDLQFHLRPQPTERLGGWACLLSSNTVYSSVGRRASMQWGVDPNS